MPMIHDRRVRPVARAVPAALLVLAAACGTSPSDAPSSSSTAAARSIAAPSPSAGCAARAVTMPADAVTVDLPSATVTVTDPGAQPRRALTLAPTRTQATTLFTNSLQVSQITGQQPSGGNRDVTVPLTAQPTCTDPTDVALYFGAPSSTDPALTHALRAEAGTVGRIRLAATGEVRSMTLNAPDGISDEAQSAFEQALLQTFTRMLPLPAEAVGAGATWTVTRHLTGETDLQQTSTVTAAAVPASGAVRLTATVDESPQTSIFTVPGSDRVLTITSYTSTGPADLTLDPALPLPASGGAALQGGRTLAGDTPGQQLVQKTGLVYRFTAD
ncbi:hypothetical protein [Tsukamurella soli]|uniref:hypothetical protein n=1 Tax=Tsukamurella soli TaxID=644556 RepID=UPI00361F7524